MQLPFGHQIRIWKIIHGLVDDCPLQDGQHTDFQVPDADGAPIPPHLLFLRRLWKHLLLKNYVKDPWS